MSALLVFRRCASACCEYMFGVFLCVPVQTKWPRDITETSVANEKNLLLCYSLVASKDDAELALRLYKKVHRVHHLLNRDQLVWATSLVAGGRTPEGDASGPAAAKRVKM